jgi:hypothetical protein
MQFLLARTQEALKKLKTCIFNCGLPSCRVLLRA